MKLSTFLKHVGANIKDARARAGLKQTDVHERTGITYRHYQSIEAGRVNVTLETLHRIASFFKVEPAELVRINHSVEEKIHRRGRISASAAR